MRVGLQTILWGRRIDDLDLVLDQIAACGYQGIEIAHDPDELWFWDETQQRSRHIEKISELLEMLERPGRNLKLIGLAGGPLKKRMEFCENHREFYLYVDEWDATAEEALATDPPFTLALHPHLFMDVHRYARAKRILRDHKEDNLKFLPDTAHLSIAGDDILQAIQKYYKRLAAVHLKDWTPDFGRHSLRYARGFLELGRGVIPLDDTLRLLDAKKYKGWIVVEQDHPTTSPEDAARSCAAWLAARKIMPSPSVERLTQLRQRKTITRVADDWPRDKELEFLRTISAPSGFDLSACAGINSGLISGTGCNSIRAKRCA
jgi:sugar phosphate isomerase/epimerase